MRKLHLESLLTILCWFFVTSNIYAIETSKYEVSTISRAQAFIEKQILQKYTSLNGINLKASGFGFCSLVQFCGVTRPISEANIDMLHILSSQNMDGIQNLYQAEILVTDSDGNEYWLPIQETHLPDLRKECEKSDKVILFLVWFMCKDGNHLILINDFFVVSDV